MPPSPAPDLSGLHELVLPAPIPAGPQTAGWLALAIVLGGVGLWLALRLYRTWAADRYRREALRLLDELTPRLRARDPSSVGALNAVLKRAALHRWPRAEVAPLSGEAWLEFLQGSAEAVTFTSGPGRLLLDLPYRPPAALEALPEAELHGLLTECRGWLERHRA